MIYNWKINRAVKYKFRKIVAELYVPLTLAYDKNMPIS